MLFRHTQGIVSTLHPSPKKKEEEEAAAEESMNKDMLEVNL